MLPIYADGIEHALDAQQEQTHISEHDTRELVGLRIHYYYLCVQYTQHYMGEVFNPQVQIHVILQQSQLLEMILAYIMQELFL